jgi:hypothetical protein
MTNSWRNVKQRQDELRERARLAHKCGWNDGYALLRPKSTQADYQAGWRAGREARLAKGITS